MINFTYMPGLETARFRVRISFLMATRTVIEFRLFVAWLDSEGRGFGVALCSLARISLPGNKDAGYGDGDNYR